MLSLDAKELGYSALIQVVKGKTQAGNIPLFNSGGRKVPPALELGWWGEWARREARMGTGGQGCWAVVGGWVDDGELQDGDRGWACIAGS